MGSVGDNYVCPWRGRVGNGGYATYGVGYPICTEGHFSCLWFSLEDRDIGTMQEFRRYQLRAIFPGTYRHHRISENNPRAPCQRAPLTQAMIAAKPWPRESG